jgi:hypothetical protein
MYTRVSGCRRIERKASASKEEGFVGRGFAKEWEEYNGLGFSLMMEAICGKEFSHMSPQDFKVTSKILWLATLIFAGIDVVYVPILARRIEAAKFRQLKWTLFTVTAIFWAAMWTWVLVDFWDSVYRYLFPAWVRWIIPPAYGLLFAGVGLLFWWLALRFRFSPVVSFCLLGGLWGVITHVWAVFLGVVDKPPLLQGVAPAAAVIVAVFEFIFYWCIILSMSALLHRCRR